MGILPISNYENKYVLVIDEYFIKFVHAIPILNQNADTVARTILDNFVTIFGVPMQVHSDQGANLSRNCLRDLNSS